MEKGTLGSSSSFKPINKGDSVPDSKTRVNPMGETKKSALRVYFDRSLKLEFHGSKVMSDAG